ncbi:CD151 antigen-like protein [Brachionus plicatilis]|uniref:CD151 antigen-like protein n=1 Tax=Brachionus plicatilis TaxID=10195 RepID=A0A3M7RIK3_BRAPC|nr:CD151 antigen-like protein [Brachionus plicatilis]
MENLRQNFFKKSNSNGSKLSAKNRLINNVINMVCFGMSLILIIIGILYLTGFKFDFSFNQFSPTLIAGLFIGLGIFVFILSICNIFLIQLERQIVLFLSFLLIILVFLALMAVGIWGLVASDETNLYEETKQTMNQEFRLYDERKIEDYYTLKIDWTQQNFNCCGIQSFSDWRSIIIMGSSGQFEPVNFVDQWAVNNNLPYMDNVPDSCCITKAFNCGKMFSGNFQSNDRSRVIFTRGCLDSYLDKFTTHITFLAGLTVAISALVLASFLFYAFTYFIFKLRYT